MSMVVSPSSRRGAPLVILGTTAIAALTGSAAGQVMGPEFARSYEIHDLGNLPSVPSAYGGLIIDPNDPSRLLLAGSANNSTGAVYSVCLERDGSGHIIGLSCEAPEVLASTPYIDGGLDFAPNGTLIYTTYSNNTMGQVLPGSSSPGLILPLADFGVWPSTGSLRVVPAGSPGAGRLKIVSYSVSRWYDAELISAGGGFWTLSVDPEFVVVAGGPEGIAYVPPGSAEFPNPSVLISMYGLAQVLAFEVDAQGDPMPETVRLFVTGLSGAEGAAIDPVTGDFLFSNFGSGADRVIRVSGFEEPPCTADFDHSGTVDGDDLGTLLGFWGTTSGSPADLNGDGLVDGDDLGTLLGQWGPCPT